MHYFNSTEERYKELLEYFKAFVEENKIDVRLDKFHRERTEIEPFQDGRPTPEIDKLKRLYLLQQDTIKRLEKTHNVTITIVRKAILPGGRVAVTSARSRHYDMESEFWCCIPEARYTKRPVTLSVSISLEESFFTCNNTPQFNMAIQHPSCNEIMKDISTKNPCKEYWESLEKKHNIKFYLTVKRSWHYLEREYHDDYDDGYYDRKWRNGEIFDVRPLSKVNFDPIQYDTTGNLYELPLNEEKSERFDEKIEIVADKSYFTFNLPASDPTV